MKSVPLVLSLVAGLVALVAVALYMSAREAALLELAETQPVVVATQDILANTVIDERVVELAEVPRAYLQPGALTDLADVVGRILAVPAPQGSQITGTALLEGAREALAFEVPRGMRAITVAVSDVSGVAGLLRPGNFVDLVGTFEYGVPSGSQGGQITYSNERTETLTLAQNIQVLAVGRLFGNLAQRPPPAPVEEAVTPDEPEEEPVENVTLLVTPEQVQEIVLAQEVGTLTVSLRSNLDAGQIVEIDRLDTLKLLQVEIPLKPRPGPSWREIRGAERLY